MENLIQFYNNKGVQALKFFYITQKVKGHDVVKRVF